MKKYALIMAGGMGHRAGTEMPKQYIELLGIPIIWHSILAFHREDAETEIVVVVHPDYVEQFNRRRAKLARELSDIPLRIVEGGSTRGESVKNGIATTPDSADVLIAVHDAARPVVSIDMIRKGWELAAHDGVAVPGCPFTDTLRHLEGSGSKSVNRSEYVAVQTPQVARGDILHAAYRLEERPEFTDEASRIDALGVDVKIFDGETTNIKVTNPEDFARAEALLRDRR